MIQNWRLELAPFSHTVEHRPGKDIVAPDSFIRGFTSSMSPERYPNSVFIPLNKSSPSSGVQNLIRGFIDQSSVLIKAGQPLKRLSIDFNGPLPEASRNAYLLTVVDEYARFTFTFPFTNMHKSIVFKCLDQIFRRDPTLRHVSYSSQSWLSPSSYKNSRYSDEQYNPSHPIGNGLVERCNDTI